ncbi:MAG: hypothetical protein DME24_24575 [Verrucomicrobia bacterium]|nr:MAG: hypothetical protein DME24_24575 [Verrucomicrobiota bacterium]
MSQNVRHRMTYRIQTFYPDAGLFMNTNHESDDLEDLKSFARTDTFRGFRIRIVDDADRVVFEPPVREREQDLSVSDIATMLGVPIVDPPNFLRSDDDDA